MSTFLQKHPKIILLLSLVFLFLPDFVMADDMGYVQLALWNLVVNFFGMFLALAASLLNVSIKYFVIEFGNLYNTGGIGVAVDAAWYSVRDIFNITFIFGLVYIGFKMILDSSDSGAKKWLIHLIMAAVLVNFSLYITKFVVDVSNVLASEIVINAFAPSEDSDGYPAVSDAFARSMGLTSLLGLHSDKSLPQGSGWGYIFGTMIFFLIATFVFAAGGLLLLIRAGVLLFYLVLSPFMFIGWVFPRLQKYTDQYWSGFLGRAFFAPLYLLFLYLSSKILTDFTSSAQYNDGGAQIGNILRGADPEVIKNSFFVSFIPFIMASLFLVVSIIIANKLGANGGDMVMSAGKNLTGKVKRGITNTTKFTAAQTAGRGARLASDYTGRSITRSLQNLQQGNGLTARIARMNAVQGTVGAGAAKLQQTKFGMGNTREQDRKMHNQTVSDADARRNIETDQTTPAITPTSNEDQITERQEARNRLENEVRVMRNDQVLDRARTNRGEVMSQEFASLLSDAQVKALAESGILTNTEMDTLKANRETGTYEEINATLTNANASTLNLTAATESLNRAVSTMSNERLVNLINTNPALITNPSVASRFSSAQMDTLQQSGNLTAAQMQGVKDARNVGFDNIVRHGSLARPTSPGGSDPSFQDKQRRALFRNAQEAGKLPANILASPNTRPYITPRIIEEFLNNNPSDPDITLVRRNIQGYLTHGGASVDVVNAWTRWSRTLPGRRFGL